MVAGVPGLGVVDDDEDWSDKSALQEFVLNSKKQLTFFFIKQLPIDDEPTYFESDEEALAMVKQHFPGKKRTLGGLMVRKVYRVSKT